MDENDSDKKNSEPGTGSLFGQSGPVSLGDGGGSSLLDRQTLPTPYETSKPYDTDTTGYQPTMPEYEIPQPVETQPVTTPAIETQSPTSYPSYSSQPPPVPSREPPRRTESAPQPAPGKKYPDSNASVSWSPSPWSPRISQSAFVHPTSMIYGNVRISDNVFISAGAMIRGENDEPIFIGTDSNVQEGVVLKDLPSRRDGVVVKQRIVDVGNDKYSLYVGNRVSLAAQCQIHGPAFIGDGVYIGMQSLVFWARVEKGVIVEPGCLIMNVTVPSGKFVPAGIKVTSQKMVADLPPLTSKYRFYGINDETVEASLEMLRGYRNLFM